MREGADAATNTIALVNIIAGVFPDVMPAKLVVKRQVVINRIKYIMEKFSAVLSLAIGALNATSQRSSSASQMYWFGLPLPSWLMLEQPATAGAGCTPKYGLR